MRLLFIIGCVLLLSACKEEELPHIPREQMTNLMMDIHTAEVYSTMVNDSLHQSLNKNMDTLAYYYKSILNHHNMTMDELKDNLQWYGQHPSEFDSVYVNILAEISTLEGLRNATN